MSQSPFVKLLNTEFAPTIHDYLSEMGYILSKPAHTFFQAKKPGLSVTFYKSGKLVVSGKKSSEFIDDYLGPEILCSQEAEHSATDCTPKIGGDEAGKGDYFGPLCVASVYASASSIDALVKLGIKDSKKLKDDKILVLDQEIRKLCPVEVVVLKPETYNTLYQKMGNLNHLLAWAHCAAASNLVEKTGCKEVLIDQFASPALLERFFAKKDLDIHLMQRVRAEEDIVVAAASMVARAEFVRGIKALSDTFSHPLPKGASSQVTAQGKSFVKTFGEKELVKVAKLHFKTTEQILDLGDLF